MPRAYFSDNFNDIHELKYGQAEEKLEAGGDEKLIFNFILSAEMRFYVSCFNTPDGLFQRWLTGKYKKVSYK